MKMNINSCLSYIILSINEEADKNIFINNKFTNKLKGAGNTKKKKKKERGAWVE